MAGDRCERRVAALYVDEQRGPYAKLPCVEAWGAEKDATRYAGPHPVITHPPCGAWGRMRKFAKQALQEAYCAPFAVDQVRRYGGVLEHPEGSTLWKHAHLPRPGAAPDQYGGYTISVDQVRWGHEARKRTWLYIVGVPPAKIPPMPPPRQPTCTVRRPQTGTASRARCKLAYSKKSQRHITPPAFAEWLVELARRAQVEKVIGTLLGLW